MAFTIDDIKTDLLALMQAVVSGADYKLYGLTVLGTAITAHVTQSYNWINGLDSKPGVVPTSTVTARPNGCKALAVYDSAIRVLNQCLKPQLIQSGISYSIDGKNINKSQLTSFIDDTAKEYARRRAEMVRALVGVGEYGDIAQPSTAPSWMNPDIGSRIYDDDYWNMYGGSYGFGH